MPPKDKGLSDEQIALRIKKYGLNLLPEKPPPSSIKIFASQLKSPLVYILLVAGLVTFSLKEIADTAIIVLAVFINTILGFIQEKKASAALTALKKLVHNEAMAIRNGKLTKVLTSGIVPGDILVLAQGNKVPADGIVLSSSRLAISEAILTGESATINKNTDDKVFMGTSVAAGRGYMKATLTGAQTEIGKIAQSVQEINTDTPIKRQLTIFSKQLSLLVLILITIVFLIGLLRQQELIVIFTTSVALAVSAIPEGLLVGLTVVLAIGMQRILKEKGLVRNLVSAETLGGVTTIATDKTGTLTEGKMRVLSIHGEKSLIAKQSILANDRDDPVVIAAWEWASKELTSKDLKSERIDSYIQKHARLDELPFSSKDRFSAHLVRHTSLKNEILVNGAPEFILEWTNLSPKKKKLILSEIDDLTSRGYRLIGMARKEVKKSVKSLSKKDAQSNLEWVGIIALSDPVRKGVKEALKKTNKAGIKTIVITGDYAQTAASVMHALNMDINSDQIVLGEELENMSEKVLAEKLKENKIKLFARTRPDQKLKIVNALQLIGEVVAMMGDGVNDAPALAQADIGIVVAEATDVAKESSDLILLDSSFNTIVKAIEEGRGIFDNLRKIILYLMSDAFSEIVAVLGSLMIGLPLPVTAAQILWINLASDGLPHLALTIDPKRRGIMSTPPRNRAEPLVSKSMKLLIAIVSLTGGIIALAVFAFVRQSTGDIPLARSTAFATLGINSLVYVFSIRSLGSPIWHDNPVKNKWLVLAVAGGLVLQIMPFVIPPLGSFLDTSPLSISLWALAFAAAGAMLVVVEMGKIIFNNKL